MIVSATAQLENSGLLRDQQATLAQAFVASGIGLHSGRTTTVTIQPAPPHTGRYFVRTDLPKQPQIAAQVVAVRPTQLSTELASETASVRTVEHLLAALVSHGIDNARIEIDGLEVPLLDGSAQQWSEQVRQAGVCLQDQPRSLGQILEPISVQQGDAFVAAFPSPTLRFSYGIDFPEAAIGKQWQTWVPEAEAFAQVIAPARTFGFAKQVEWLRSQGLIQGGSLDNALICDETGWVNPPLRFENEPARHKLLDLLGDLSLLGTIPQAHYVAYKASHQLHTQLAAKIQQTFSDLEG